MLTLLLDVLTWTMAPRPWLARPNLAHSHGARAAASIMLNNLPDTNTMNTYLAENEAMLSQAQTKVAAMQKAIADLESQLDNTNAQLKSFGIEEGLAGAGLSEGE